MGRGVPGGQVYTQQGGLVPVRWTALEALAYGTYSDAHQ